MSDDIKDFLESDDIEEKKEKKEFKKLPSEDEIYKTDDVLIKKEKKIEFFKWIVFIVASLLIAAFLIFFFYGLKQNKFSDVLNTDLQCNNTCESSSFTCPNITCPECKVNLSCPEIKVYTNST